MPFALAVRQDGEVGDPADFALAVDAGGDVTNYLAIFLPHKDAARPLASHVVVDVAQLAKLPVASADSPETLFDVVVDGYAGEANGRDVLERGQIRWAIGANHRDQLPVDTGICNSAGSGAVSRPASNSAARSLAASILGCRTPR